MQFDYVVAGCGHATGHCPASIDKAKVVHVWFEDSPQLTEDLPQGAAQLTITLLTVNLHQIYFAIYRNMNHPLNSIMDVLKAMSDPNRLRLLYALRQGELCVCQLIALLELAPSTVSKHLTILRSARLIENRKEGRWIHYRLTKQSAIRKVVALLFDELEQTPEMAADEKRLKRICSEGLDTLCRRLFCKSGRG